MLFAEKHPSVHCHFSESHRFTMAEENTLWHTKSELENHHLQWINEL
jgi:hypothetical protein